MSYGAGGGLGKDQSIRAAAGKRPTLSIPELNTAEGGDRGLPMSSSTLEV
jgi:hypothetical protein